MAIGDGDMGVFFNANDFAKPVVFNNVTAQGLFDEPGRDATFGDVSVSDSAPTLLLSASAFTPMPVAGATPSRLTVAGVAYQVRSVNPLDDGAIVQLRLKKL